MNNLPYDNIMNDIAIIGMSGRFPKARDVDTLWRNLREGKECISFFSDSELQSSGVPSDLISNPNYVKAKGILEDIEFFDASFFGFNPKEAETIDPQHRLFLECAWEALESSGYNSQHYNGLIGVYAGTSLSGYLIHNLLPRTLMEATGLDYYQNIMGNDKDHISTRVSYKLNLRGPSVAIQTACSTSLVNVVMACQSLLSYQCDIALAGGVSITVPEKKGYLYQEGLIFSPDGRCRAFDAKAKGTVLGDGVAIVVLKRLPDALTENDHIRAVIKGSAVNNDGSLKVGYTAPSVNGQAEVIAMAQAMGEIEPETISYVEAHGTGTPIGDPIEVAALTKAFRAGTAKKKFCALGSLKTNIGHLDAAAGVAGLIKTVLSLENRQIPPSLNCEEPNPKIDFDSSPFFVNTELSEWATGESPRRAGVSSFGMGGTNAHVVVEEAPKREKSSSSRPWQLLVLSAKTETALSIATENLVKHLREHSEQNLADVAYTLQVGRRRFRNRRIIVCQKIDEAAHAIGTVDPKNVYTNNEEMDKRDVVFMFSGQGSQYVNMAAELYQIEPTFRKTVDFCSEILIPQIGCDLRHIIYPIEEPIDEAARRLSQTSIAQPALFVLEFALTELFAEWGIRPKAMIGHSVGEYVAACLAGVLSLENALELVAMRGRLIQKLPKGSMLAVELSENEVLPLIGQNLSIAAVNGSSSCVISGTDGAVNVLQEKLTAEGISYRPLHTSHAFHSEMMEPAMPLLKEYIQNVNLKPPTIKYVSNVTGTWLTDEEATDPLYWVRHLRQTVRFADGIAELLKMPDAILLEVGPGQALGTIVRRHTEKASKRVVLASLHHPKEQVSDLALLLKTLGRLWLAGVNIDWDGFYKNERRHRIPLPTYPFERKRFWIEPSRMVVDREPIKKKIIKNQTISDWFYVPSWKRSDQMAITEGGLNCRNLNWLVFVDQCHLGAKVLERLKREGSTAICVMIGNQFNQASEDIFSVNPRIRDNYCALFRELKAQNRLPDRIIHLWGVTQDAQVNKECEFYEESQYLGFYSLLFLVQAMEEIKQRSVIQLDVITNNVHEVTGEESLCPEKSTVLGPCKVILQEFPDIKCRNIDIAFPTRGKKQESILIEQIWAELTGKSSGQFIAYRGRYRWLQTFERIKFEVSFDEIPSLIRKNGVYLITGGLGYIGLTLSKYLAKVAPAKLILMGNTDFPKKSDWKQWIATHDADDSVTQKIKKIQELEELGAEVFVYNADVADFLNMQEVINEIYMRFGCLNGVIHTAGVVKRNFFQAIQDADAKTCAKHFKTKIEGLHVLEKLLRGRTLDFCLLGSSLSSIIGGKGFAAYSAANIFMDTFAHKCNRNSKFPWVSINFDDWKLREDKDTGDSIQSVNADLDISVEEGSEIFKCILSLPKISQVVVSNGSLKKRIAEKLTFESIPNIERAHAVRTTSSQANSGLTDTSEAPRTRSSNWSLEFGRKH